MGGFCLPIFLLLEQGHPTQLVNTPFNNGGRNKKNGRFMVFP